MSQQQPDPSQPTSSGDPAGTQAAPSTPLRAVVTGASSGIGAATVRHLRRAGWDVVAVARRADRLAALAEETGAQVVVADLTVADDVARLAAEVTAGGPVHALVNNAGGALGTDRVEASDVERWRRMYEINVLGTLQVTMALLPALRDSGRGDVVVLTSTAAHGTYPGGAGYVAAKHGERVIADTLRLEPRGRACPRHRDRPGHGPHRGVLAHPLRRRPGQGRRGLRRG